MLRRDPVKAGAIIAVASTLVVGLAAAAWFNQRSVAEDRRREQASLRSAIVEDARQRTRTELTQALAQMQSSRAPEREIAIIRAKLAEVDGLGQKPAEE